MQTASAQSSCNWSFSDFSQQISLQRKELQLHALQNRLQSGVSPAIAMGRKAVLHLHDGPGLAAKSSKLGSECLSAQTSFARLARWLLGNVVLPNIHARVPLKKTIGLIVDEVCNQICRGGIYLEAIDRFGWILWSPRSLQKGNGGSPSSVIQRRLKRQHWEPTSPATTLQDLLSSSWQFHNETSCRAGRKRPRHVA